MLAYSPLAYYPLAYALLVGAPEAITPPQPTGGWENWKHVASPRTKKQILDERERLGITVRVAKVLDEVALNLVDELGIDEETRKAELKYQLKLRNIKYEIKYLNALNAQYKLLINDELAYRMQMREDEMIIALLM